LKFKKLAKFMATKGEKKFHNIKTIDFNVKPHQESYVRI
jgi:hypothetical protein